MTADPQPVQWSYSAYKRYDNCPRQYYHLTVAKDYRQGDTEALRTGSLVHKIAEDFVNGEAPIPETHHYLKEFLEPVSQLPGGKVTEYKMAVKRDFTPCDFDSPQRWWRGIADLVVFDRTEREKALLVDYKTGKNIKYADVGQLNVLAAALFSHFPNLKSITGSLFFVTLGEAVTQNYERPINNELWRGWEVRLKYLEASYHNDVWNPKSGPLCRFCPVSSCEHHRG